MSLSGFWSVWLNGFWFPKGHQALRRRRTAKQFFDFREWSSHQNEKKN